MDLRPSPIAGRWYPAEAIKLAQSIDAYLDAARDTETIAGEVCGLIVPHAGHVYSGPVAAHAFRRIKALDIDTVVVICPSHFHDDGPLVTSGHAAYLTPLGIVPVDHATLTALRAECELVDIRHDREHAIEIELPFLQRALMRPFQLVPLMARDQSAARMHVLGVTLARILQGRRVLWIGSSDLSHYYPHETANQLDAAMLKQIAAFDPEGVLATEAHGAGMACGHGAIAATLWATRECGATRASVVRHATSGEVTGDYGQVVGYGAAVIWKESPQATP